MFFLFLSTFYYPIRVSLILIDIALIDPRIFFNPLCISFLYTYLSFFLSFHTCPRCSSRQYSSPLSCTLLLFFKLSLLKFFYDNTRIFIHQILYISTSYTLYAICITIHATKFVVLFVTTDPNSLCFYIGISLYLS